MGAGGSYQPGVTGGQSSVVLTTSNLPEVSGTTNIEDATHTHDTLIANNPVLFVAFDQSTLGLSAPGDRSAMVVGTNPTAPNVLNVTVQYSTVPFTGIKTVTIALGGAVATAPITPIGTFTP